jgi:hypothetical protein
MIISVFTRHHREFVFSRFDIQTLRLIIGFSGALQGLEGEAMLKKWGVRIGPIGLIRPISSGLFLLLPPVVQPCAGHVLAEASFFEKVLFQPADLLVQQVVRLMDEADGDVGEDFGWASVHISPIGLIGLIF